MKKHKTLIYIHLVHQKPRWPLTGNKRRKLSRLCHRSSPRPHPRHCGIYLFSLWHAGPLEGIARTGTPAWLRCQLCRRLTSSQGSSTSCSANLRAISTLTFHAAHGGGGGRGGHDSHAASARLKKGPPTPEEPKATWSFLSGQNDLPPVAMARSCALVLGFTMVLWEPSWLALKVGR
jgi:hypothetical protein